jgi:histone acetyltransferase (RNA polymerase elongator complex component)
LFWELDILQLEAKWKHLKVLFTWGVWKRRGTTRVSSSQVEGLYQEGAVEVLTEKEDCWKLKDHKKKNFKATDTQCVLTLESKPDDITKEECADLFYGVKWSLGVEQAITGSD